MRGAPGPAAGGLRVLSLASEATPWCKTGGLADVAGALPAAVQAVDPKITVSTLLPLYPQVRASARRLGLRLLDTGLRPALRHRRGARIFTVRAPGPPVFFLELRGVFDRPTLYGGDHSAYVLRGYEDNVERFAALAEAAALCCDALCGGRADLVHLHDWQSAALPGLLRQQGRALPTLLTVHNLAYQGEFGPSEALGLPLGAALRGGPYQLRGAGNLLAGGLRLATQLSTVSPTYAREVCGPALGCGLDAILAERGVIGVRNGLDTAAWDPRVGAGLAAPFSAEDLGGKSACKRALLAELGLLREPGELLLGVVSRLVEQKGLDLLLELAPRLREIGARLVVLGEGDPELVAALRACAEAHRARFALRVAFDDGLARRIIAGSDALLVPSRFEPCGLTQLAAQRMGTVPIVNPTGGLADTVDDPGDAGLAAGRGSGLHLARADGPSLVAAVERAARWARDAPDDWRALQRRIMELPVGWAEPAAAYAGLYRGLAEGGAARSTP